MDAETDHMLATLRARGDKLCTDAAAEIERLYGTLNVVRIYLDQNPLGDAVVVPRGTTLHAGSDLSPYPTLRTLVDAALGVEQEGDKS